MENKGSESSQSSCPYFVIQNSVVALVIEERSESKGSFPFLPKSIHFHNILMSHMSGVALKLVNSAALSCREARVGHWRGVKRREKLHLVKKNGKRRVTPTLGGRWGVGGDIVVLWYD